MAVIHCLGTGLVGSYVAKKLAENGHQVYAHDINPDITLVDYPNITIEEGDALEKCSDIINLGKFDIIVNMLPGDIGHTVIKKLCKYDVKVVDLSFSEITPDIVIAECENMNATILWDVGIAPGLSNMLLAMAYREF